MNTYNPGPGWRQLRGNEPLHGPWVHTGDDEDDDGVFWVRQESTVPLPNEPNTIVKVTWSKGARAGVSDALWLTPGGVWIDEDGTIYDPDGRITDFEVLAEPRAGAVARAEDSARRLTAKAVLNRIASEPWAREIDLTKWRVEFGVPE